MYVVKGVTFATILLRNAKTVAGIAAVVSAATVLHITVLNHHLSPSTLAVTVLGIAISFFIGFINSQAYVRWREAREVWGALANDSRSFARMVVSFFPEHEGALRNMLVRRHIAFLYALKDELREESTGAYLAYLDETAVEVVRQRAHPTVAILELQGKAIHQATKASQIDGFQMSLLNGMLASFTDAMGRSERIKQTVFPALYVSMVHMAVWIFLLAFPVAASEESGYWAILYGTLVGAIFVLTLRAGQLLLDPFENQPTDIPMSAITRTIEIDLLEQIGADEIPAPVEPIDGIILM